MKSKPTDGADEVASLFRRLHDLQRDRRSIDEEQDAIVNWIQRLSISSPRDDSVPMVRATAVPSTPAFPPFKPGTRVWIKKVTKHGGKGGVITSRRHRSGGTYWNIKLDNPGMGKTDAYKLESNLKAV